MPIFFASHNYNGFLPNFGMAQTLYRGIKIIQIVVQNCSHTLSVCEQNKKITTNLIRRFFLYKFFFYFLYINLCLLATL